jgi:hypothetical protein
LVLVDLILESLNTKCECTFSIFFFPIGNDTHLVLLCQGFFFLD